MFSNIVELRWECEWFDKTKGKEVGFLTYRRQLTFKVSDKLVRKLTNVSVLPWSRNVFTSFECRIVPIYISYIAKVLGPNHLSNFPEQLTCLLVNEQSYLMWSLTLFPVLGSSDMRLTSLPREVWPLCSRSAVLPPLGTNCVSPLPLVASSVLPSWVSDTFFFCRYFQSFPALTKSLPLTFFLKLPSFVFPLAIKITTQVFLHFFSSASPDAVSCFPPLFFLAFLQPLTFLTALDSLV